MNKQQTLERFTVVFVVIAFRTDILSMCVHTCTDFLLHASILIAN